MTIQSFLQFVVTEWKALVGLITIPIFCQTLAYRFSSSRDRKNKLRDNRLQYLIQTYRSLALAVQRKPTPGAQHFRDMEAAVADIQLFGTPDQIKEIRSFLDEYKRTSKGSLNNLLKLLRSELRKELRLSEISDGVHWFRPEGGVDIDENDSQPARHKETKEAEMNLTEKRYEFVTQQVRYFNEKILDTFSLFVKLSLSIVGGIFWLCSQETVEKFKKITPIIPWLIPMVGIYAALMIVKNLMTQWGFRKAESDLIGTDKLPYPSWKSVAAEILMILAIVAVSALSCIFFKGLF